MLKNIKILFAGIVFLLPFHSARAAKISAYIPAYVSGNVAVIDLPDVLGPVISGSAGSQGVSFTPDGAFVYVTNQTANSVSKIEVSSNTLIENISVNDGPLGVAVSPEGDFIYVANLFSNSVDVIDASNDTVIASVSACGVPRGIAFTPDGAFAYVTCGLDDTVVVINVATQSLVGAPIVVGASPIGIAMAPDATHAYVTNVAGNTVSVINVETQSVDATISVGNQPIGIVISPDGSRLYVSNNADDTVSVMNTSNNTVIGSGLIVGGGPYGISITPDGATVYVVNSSDATVSPIDTQSLEVGTAIDISASINTPIAFGNFITPSPVLLLEPETYAFSDQEIGTSSDPVTFTLRNRGTALLRITDISVSGDFSQTNNCGLTVNSAESCSIFVSFTPSAEGVREGNISITDNVQNFDNAEIVASPQVFSLSGTGTATPLPPPPTPTPGALQGACSLHVGVNDFSNGVLGISVLNLALLWILKKFHDSKTSQKI